MCLCILPFSFLQAPPSPTSADVISALDALQHICNKGGCSASAPPLSPSVHRHPSSSFTSFSPSTLHSPPSSFTRAHDHAARALSSSNHAVAPPFLAHEVHACGFAKCQLVERLVCHFAGCSVKVSGGCSDCGVVWQLLKLHSARCQDTKACSVPLCR